MRKLGIYFFCKKPNSNTSAGESLSKFSHWKKNRQTMNVRRHAHIATTSAAERSIWWWSGDRRRLTLVAALRKEKNKRYRQAMYEEHAKHYINWMKVHFVSYAECQPGRFLVEKNRMFLGYVAATAVPRC